MKDDAISRQRVLKLLSAMTTEDATTKALLIQSVKQMDAAQPSGPDNLVKDSQGLAKDLVNDCISRKAAIDAIKDDKIDLTNPNVVAVFKATGDFEKVETQVMTCDRHIEILKDLLPAQPYTDEEIQKIQELEEAQLEKAYELGYQAGCAAQPERKRGKWIDDGDPFMWECGCCGYRVKRYNNTRYCPNCGADMREVSE